MTNPTDNITAGIFGIRGARRLLTNDLKPKKSTVEYIVSCLGAAESVLNFCAANPDVIKEAYRRKVDE